MVEKYKEFSIFLDNNEDDEESLSGLRTPTNTPLNIPMTDDNTNDNDEQNNHMVED
jgi:hypothetical protein